MDIDKKFTVSFGEYQPEDFPFPFQENNMGYEILEHQIKVSILKALDLGYRWFMCGMSKGFDLLCADILIEIQENYPEYLDIWLILVEPYADYLQDEKTHQALYNCARQIVIASPEYREDCFQLSNEYMIKKSSYLIYYSSEKNDLKCQRLLMAQKENLHIENVHNNKLEFKKAKHMK